MDLVYDYERSFPVRKISQLVERQATPKNGSRAYFYEMFPRENRAWVVPVTFNKPAVREEQVQAIKRGDLFYAYQTAWIAGYSPEIELMRRYPWWKKYMHHLYQASCVKCGVNLFEDRALSKQCEHQLCTKCAVIATEDAQGAIIKCAVCDTITNYMVMNGEQCDDNRQHPVVILP